MNSSQAPPPPPHEPLRAPAGQQAKTSLRLKGVHAGYGAIKALKGIDLEVHVGEVVALIGANGAGKSTTLNTICGLVRATMGSIDLFGVPIHRLPTEQIVARGVAQAPEGRRLFSDMTVLENLEMGAFLRRDRQQVRRDIKHAYELFPILGKRCTQRAGSLSGGEQQMCAIARCMLSKPRLMLLDEPSLGLAPLICRDIFHAIRKLNDDGTTIFLVEQNARAALKLADRAYVMETGTIVMQGEAAELLEDPRVRDAYLGVGE